MIQTRIHAARLLFGLGVALCASSPALAQTDPASRLTELLEPLHTYSADFQQRVQGDDGQSLQDASGHMWLARPGKFRWEVNAPYSQTVVSDGAQVYMYDPDLEQVTVRALDPKVTSTPALLLSGSAGELTSNYGVSMRAQGDTEIFSLSPRGNDSLFESLEMTFQGQRLTGLDLVDATGQRTEIGFDSIEQNGSVDDSRFAFQIPEGADVIREQ
ncbi:outer membrane lipoprotein chaperone LolA [Halotalea alkalilenta]|uniref:outer membrane lipoprotein chaperone LolA n=1 Tax=Halotalea alkalilenta TaxID=376489 RepID=UPI000693B605|nr:outer membrane lipoprotein chaperone LolA [Halotalea alkalilenta]